MISVAQELQVVLRSKFRGCLLGALYGDCFGAQFENEPFSGSGKYMTQRFFDGMDKSTRGVLYKKHTDDFAQTRSIAETLIKTGPNVDYGLMAKNLTQEYVNDPKRNKNDSAITIYRRWEQENFGDLFGPAKQLFKDQGSFGNGAASRIAPIALYFCKDYNKMIEVARKSSLLTHSHDIGVNGALLQCIAVHEALMTLPSNPVDPSKFIDGLLDKIGSQEKIIELPYNPEELSSIEKRRYKELGLPLTREPIFKSQLTIVKDILTKHFENQEDQDNEVMKHLGNEMTAFQSVPTAIYCFLRALTDVEGIRAPNVLRRGVQYAISFGGDTDTIASMTGALAGAYVGDGAVSEVMMSHMESSEEAVKLADGLYERCLE